MSVGDVRLGTEADAAQIGELLDAFNREFGEPTPGPGWLAGRIVELLAQDAVVLLAGSGPDGLAVLRFRGSIWTQGLECYLAELYVVPDRRGRGLGRALMMGVLDAARERGADQILLGTSEDDRVARTLFTRASDSSTVSVGLTGRSPTSTSETSERM